MFANILDYALAEAMPDDEFTAAHWFPDEEMLKPIKLTFDDHLLSDDHLFDILADYKENLHKFQNTVISKSEHNSKSLLLDHCYHWNKPDEPTPLVFNKRYNLGAESLSDAGESLAISQEEDTDVVTFENPSRPELPQQQKYQKIIDTALREKTKQPRGRGRPPFGTTARKRNAKTADFKTKLMKRAKASRNCIKKSPGGLFAYGPVHDISVTDSEIRRIHNSRERMRRSQLNSQFECLRCSVPAIKNHKKRTKIDILCQSTAYIKSLQDASDKIQEQINPLRAQQYRLMSRLSQLRRELASKRCNLYR